MILWLVCLKQTLITTAQVDVYWFIASTQLRLKPNQELTAAGVFHKYLLIEGEIVKWFIVIHSVVIIWISEVLISERQLHRTTGDTTNYIHSHYTNEHIYKYQQAFVYKQQMNTTRGNQI